MADRAGTTAKKLAESLRKSVKKSGITLEITHHFFSDSELLDFLAQNTLNVCMYDPFELCAMRGGLSSAVDQAISVRRPIAITNNPLLRHLASIKPSIVIKYWNFKIIYRCLRSYIKSLLKPLYVLIKRRNVTLAHKYFEIAIENLYLPFQILLSYRRTNFNSMSNIIKNGIKPIEHLYVEWSDENFQKSFTQIMLKIIETHKNDRRCFNRILDDKARTQYQKVIQTLFESKPEIMQRKVPRANVQQAFVLDTVRRFALPDSKILSVRIEDTAHYALLKLRYRVEGIDPAINHDLDAFSTSQQL